MNLQQNLSERLIRYAKVDTQSNMHNSATPTTPGQRELAELLVTELENIGMSDVTIDDNSYVMATLPANSDKEIPTIGLLAHLDTATEITGKNVNPQIHENYDGKTIVLNEALNVVMNPTDYPALQNYLGHTLITTDGTTLLGADNKAGIAEIMTALDYLIQNSDIKHGKIRVAFTPDEEIGRGPHKFDVEKFAADFAYTIDGGPIGELQYESFNAADARVTFFGTNVHPGTAKNKLVHAMKIANEFMNLFPEKEAPEHTEGYEGFYHPLTISGDVEKTEVYYIIRDFDSETFAERKATFRRNITRIQNKYGERQVEFQMNDQYYNMREKIAPVIEIVEVAETAMKKLNIKPLIEPIRGGTDGSQLSFKGLPTPNIFTGGENFHGKFEFASVNDMEKAVEVIVEICQSFEKQA